MDENQVPPGAPPVPPGPPGDPSPAAPMLLTPEMIRQIPGEQRSVACAEEINAALRKWNCIYKNALHLDNDGYHIQTKIVGLAYPIEIPGGMIGIPGMGVFDPNRLN